MRILIAFAALALLTASSADAGPNCRPGQAVTCKPINSSGAIRCTCG